MALLWLERPSGGSGWVEQKWLGDVWLRASGHAGQSTKDIKGRREREGS